MSPFGVARGEPVDWELGSFRRGSADMTALLEASENFAGGAADVVAIDMPVATVTRCSFQRDGFGYEELVWRERTTSVVSAQAARAAGLRK